MVGGGRGGEGGQLKAVDWLLRVNLGSRDRTILGSGPTVASAG